MIFMSKPKKIHSMHVGDIRVLTHKQTHYRFSDPYHFILTLSWSKFFMALFGFFVITNAFFGAIYWLIPNSVNNASKDNYIDYFFFSIETLATVGYGFMSPANVAAHLVASLEILIGMVSVALMTGLVFARFAKPTARILFSKNAVFGKFDGKPALMIRVANERHNRIVEATAKLSLIRNETTLDGEKYTRIYDLHLVRERTPVFALTLTLIHLIDEKSLLFNLDSEQLAATKTRIILNVTGHDETMSASVYAGTMYAVSDMVFNGRFADVLMTTEDGERVVDMTRFNDVEGN
jgi:inward rectifier potassium channel